jgi:hypothetical protein
MKNLFLSLVLLLTVSFAFANNEVEKVSIFNDEKKIELTTFDFSAENYAITKVVGTCYITLSFYGVDGESLAIVTLALEYGANEQKCSGFVD